MHAIAPLLHRVGDDVGFCWWWDVVLGLLFHAAPWHELWPLGKVACCVAQTGAVLRRMGVTETIGCVTLVPCLLPPLSLQRSRHLI